MSDGILGMPPVVKQREKESGKKEREVMVIKPPKDCPREVHFCPSNFFSLIHSISQEMDLAKNLFRYSACSLAPPLLRRSEGVMADEFPTPL